MAARLLLLLASLAAILGPAGSWAPPYERAWLRVRSDAKLGGRLLWNEFSALKGDSIGAALAKELGGGGDDDDDDWELDGATDLHLYKLVPVELATPVGELRLAAGESLYLSGEDLASR